MKKYTRKKSIKKITKKSMKRKSLKKKSPIKKKKSLKGGGNKLNCDLIYIDNYFEKTEKNMDDYEHFYTKIHPIKDYETRRAFIETLRNLTGPYDSNYFKRREHKYKKQICEKLNSFMDRYKDIEIPHEYIDKIFNLIANKSISIDLGVDLLDDDSEMIKILNEI